MDQDNRPATALAALLRSLPICSTADDDVRVRSAMVSFSFGPEGIGDLTVEERIPSRSQTPADSK